MAAPMTFQARLNQFNTATRDYTPPVTKPMGRGAPLKPGTPAPVSQRFDAPAPKTSERPPLIPIPMNYSNAGPAPSVAKTRFQPPAPTPSVVEPSPSKPSGFKAIRNFGQSVIQEVSSLGKPVPTPPRPTQPVSISTASPVPKKLFAPSQATPPPPQPSSLDSKKTSITPPIPRPTASVASVGTISSSHTGLDIFCTFLKPDGQTLQNKRRQKSADYEKDLVNCLDVSLTVLTDTGMSKLCPDLDSTTIHFLTASCYWGISDLITGKTTLTPANKIAAARICTQVAEKLIQNGSLASKDLGRQFTLLAHELAKLSEEKVISSPKSSFVPKTTSFELKTMPPGTPFLPGVNLLTW